MGAHAPPPLAQKYHKFACLALQASKSVHHFHAPPFSKSPGSAPAFIHPFISLLCSQSATYLPTYQPSYLPYLTYLTYLPSTYLPTYDLCEHSSEPSSEHSYTCPTFRVNAVLFGNYCYCFIAICYHLTVLP